MAKSFRPSSRETRILSEIESSRDQARRLAIRYIREKDVVEPLSNAIAMKLVENKFVETTNKNAIEEQLGKCLEQLAHASDFNIDYQISPFRQLVGNPHIVSLYITAFVLERLIDHKDVVDIYGSDEEIYSCVNRQVLRFLT